MKKHISPSILSADFFNLKDQLLSLKNAGMEFVHIDVMDGHFVPNITIGPIVCDSIHKNAPQLKLDIHLMIENPGHYIESFAKSKPYIIYIHQEADNHIDRLVNLIKSFNIKAGVSINPATPISTLETILPFIDSVLIMSVNPGFGGQKFIDYTLDKIKKLYKMKEKLNPKLFISIDGGVNKENIEQISDAGVELFVAGSAVFKNDYINNFKNLTNLINK